jgi:hypothetical protein
VAGVRVRLPRRVRCVAAAPLRHRGRPSGAGRSSVRTPTSAPNRPGRSTDNQQLRRPRMQEASEHRWFIGSSCVPRRRCSPAC